MKSMPTLHNGGVIPLADIPLLSHDDFATAVKGGLASGARVAACFAVPDNNHGTDVIIYALLADSGSSTITVFGHLPGSTFPSLAAGLPQLHLFEREIAEQYGVSFPGHPWFKPVRFHASWNATRDAWGRNPTAHPVPGNIDYFRVEGPEVHEVG